MRTIAPKYAISYENSKHFFDERARPLFPLFLFQIGSVNPCKPNSSDPQSSQLIDATARRALTWSVEVTLATSVPCVCFQSRTVVNLESVSCCVDRTCWRTRVSSSTTRSSLASWPTWPRACTTFTRRCWTHTATSRVRTVLSTLAGPSRSAHKCAMWRNPL